MKAIKVFFAIVIALVVGFVAGQLVDINLFTKSSNTYRVGVMEEQINEISELASLEYRYTNTDVLEGDALQAFGKDIPFTSKSMTVQYQGIIKLGPDMSEAKLSLKNSKLTVVLPSSKVLSHEIDEDSWQILDKNNGLFNPVTPEDNQDFRKSLKKKMNESLEEEGLIEKANEQAKEQVASFFEAAYPDLKVVVLIEGEEDDSDDNDADTAKTEKSDKSDKSDKAEKSA
jgi:hypothetical protein